ncbi:hypothetical protein RSAG8_05170, partial [Rhizoctonia solani AG-8 WAC10335]
MLGNRLAGKSRKYVWYIFWNMVFSIVRPFVIGILIWTPLHSPAQAHLRRGPRGQWYGTQVQAQGSRLANLEHRYHHHVPRALALDTTSKIYYTTKSGLIPMTIAPSVLHSSSTKVTRYRASSSWQRSHASYFLLCSEPDNYVSRSFTPGRNADAYCSHPHQSRKILLSLDYREDQNICITLFGDSKQLNNQTAKLCQGYQGSHRGTRQVRSS